MDASRPITDRELLLGIHGNVKNLKESLYGNGTGGEGDIPEIKDVLTNHDVRITANERFKWKALGALALLIPAAAALGGVVNAWFNKLISS